MHKKHRIFIAINLPNDIKKYFTGFEKKWADIPAKWTYMENLHITLLFLGDLTDEELGEVCIITKEVVKHHHSFDITLQKIEYGPDGKLPPRMIWANGEKSKELSLLKRDLENALLEKVNFLPDNKSFSPHITLARVSTFLWRQIEPEERPEVNEPIDVQFTVESVEVMESELKKNGPRYTIIESHQLQ
jgi:2'-5' RNA ligase